MHGVMYHESSSSREQNHSELMNPSRIDLASKNPHEPYSALLEAARSLLFVRPLVPYPGWRFDADWDNPDLAFQLRRKIWGWFRDAGSEMQLVVSWYDDLQMALHLGNDLSKQLFVGGCIEPNELALLARILAPGTVFVDAGAHEGLYSLFAARRIGDSGRVLAFEPSQREFSRLNRNLALNKLANVQAFRTALSNCNGSVELLIAEDEHSGQNTLGEFVHQDIGCLRRETVEAETLDSVVAREGLERLDVLKIDVEGAEARLLEGSVGVLRTMRPIVFFEASDSALQQQGSSLDRLLGILRSTGYLVYGFAAETGLPVRIQGDRYTDNLVAAPAERPLPESLSLTIDVPGLTVGVEPLPEKTEVFSPGRAYWNQRFAIARSKERILTLSAAVEHSTDLWPYQWAQLMATALEFHPDLILELGRGAGNSTCVFTEVANQLGPGSCRVLSLCRSEDWEARTRPRLRGAVPESWFEPLAAVRADILTFDYHAALAGARRVLLFWDAHGFAIAECVLGAVLPELAGRTHLVIMHDLSDLRYVSSEHLQYGEYGLWKNDDWSGPRLKIGNIDSAVAQSIAILDFTTRNRLTLDSADHSNHSQFEGHPEKLAELGAILGDQLFNLQAHWFYFSLNEHPGPYTFPRFRPLAPEQANESRMSSQ